MKESLKISTKGKTDIINITEKIQNTLKNSKIKKGIINVFVKHTTSALMIMEYEPGLIKDTKLFFEELVPKDNNYYHNKLNQDDNGNAHLCSSILKPDLTLPFENNKLSLGTWQQIVLIDFDTHSREREIVVTIIQDP